MDMFREQFKFNLMARDGRPLASKTTTKVPVPFVVVGRTVSFGDSVSWRYH